MINMNINKPKLNFEINNPILKIYDQIYSQIPDLPIETNILRIPYKNNYLKFLGRKRDISKTFTEKQIYKGIIEVFESERDNELIEKNKENAIYGEEEDEIFFNENSNKSLIIGEYKKESDNTIKKNKIESDTSAKSNNINRELNKMKTKVLKKNKKDKQNLEQSEMITLNSDDEEKGEEEEEKEEDEGKSKESEIKDQNEKNENKKKVEFLVKTKKKRGKERKNKRNGNSNIKIHSKNDYDNVITSIQVHYINFIIRLTNDILSSVYQQKKDLLFKDISYEFKKTINFNHFESLKSFSIKEILLNPISSKFKSKNYDNYNKEIYNKVVDSSKWLNEFFNMNYLTLFKNYYFNKNKRLTQITIKEKSINLSNNTKSFFDLYNKCDNERKNLLIKNIYRAYFGVRETGEKNNLKTIIFKSSK